MIRLTVKGNTYRIKDILKGEGFRWNGTAWSRTFKEEEAERAKSMGRYAGNGVTIDWKTVNESGKSKRYPVKMDWIANLESMGDKLFVIGEDLREGKISFPIEIAGKKIKDFNDLEDLKEEAYILKYKAWNGGLTGKEYGRARQIVAWRVQVRYNTCLAAGMDEREAGRCFEEM